MSTRWTAVQVEENNRQRRAPAAKPKAESFSIPPVVVAVWAAYEQGEALLWETYKRGEAVLWAEAERTVERGG